jgi:hypothetical protein
VELFHRRPRTGACPAHSKQYDPCEKPC